MKITDFALVFIGIALPIIIIVYVNVSFTIKAVEEEMYYQKIIDSALADATQIMKEVESDDKENDYGYSGEIDNKVSINAQVASDTFFNSLYNNFSIKGNKDAEMLLKYFVPAIAVIDYNGIYISSIEEFQKDGINTIDHVVKPKRYFSFTYGLNGSIIHTNLKDIEEGRKFTSGYAVHTVEFSTDDYIVHRGEKKYGATKTIYAARGFYIADAKNNFELYDNNTAIRDVIVDFLKEKRKEVIIQIITSELTYAVNKHNHYASLSGIHYAFSFPHTTKDEMYRYVEDIGMLAFVQGISVGNKYLNYKSYGGSNLELANRYYLTIPKAGSKYPRNLYHKDVKCPEYVVSDNSDLTPAIVNTKQQAASLTATRLSGVDVIGFYPCPVCRP